MKSCRRVYF